jgi:hypothetical protein
MPKQNVPLNKFEGGIQNRYDRRDVPENALVSLVDVCPDIPGQLRHMGGEVVHGELAEEFITGQLLPGYGLFAFNADFSVADNIERASKLLAVQQANSIGIFDSTATPSDGVTKLNNQEITVLDVANSVDIKPVFTFIDGELKICDSDFSNYIHYEDFVYTYKYIRKNWFYNVPDVLIGISIPTSYMPELDTYTDDGHLGLNGDWFALSSHIYPPTCADGVSGYTDGGATHQLYSHTNLERDDNTNFPGDSNTTAAHLAAELENGNITLAVCHGDDGLVDQGEWMIDDSMKFGISFQYDNGQESQVTSFYHTFSNAKDNVPLSFQLYAAMRNVGVQHHHNFGDFDIRLNGINLYWTGDSSGIFDDPLWLGYWHWGTSAEDLTYFESHEGERTTVIEYLDNGTSGNAYYTAGNDFPLSTPAQKAGLRIDTLPSLTFEIRNGYSNESKSIAAKYKTIVIANRRAYIGGIEAHKILPLNPNMDEQDSAAPGVNCSKQAGVIKIEQNLDRMIKSPVNQFDIFPEENFIDVAINDGESITHLMAYNDRILQFKESSLYIINISGDYEYLEAQYKYMGIKYPYQVTETELGIIWVNKLGCFLYNGEGPPKNLLQDKLRLATADHTDIESEKFYSWDTFIGNTGMIGYIQKMKQVVLFEDPASASSGDVLILDLPTQSWSFGFNRISLSPKSNIIINYDDTCMYVANKDASGVEMTVNHYQDAMVGTPSKWLLSGLVGSFSTDEDGTYLQIGSHRITLDMQYYSTQVPPFSDNGITVNFGSYLAAKVNQFSSPLSAYYHDDTGTLVITLAPNLVGTTIDTFSGENLTFSQTVTVSAVSIRSTTMNNLKHFRLQQQLLFKSWAFEPGIPSGIVGQLQPFPEAEQFATQTSVLDIDSGNDLPSNYYTTDGLTWYSIPLLLQHCSLNGLLFSDEYRDTHEVYNPIGRDGFAVENTDYGLQIRAGTVIGSTIMQGVSMTKLLLLNGNIDDTPTITLTRSSGDWDWSGATVTDRIILKPSAHKFFDRYSDDTHYLGWINPLDSSIQGLLPAIDGIIKSSTSWGLYGHSSEKDPENRLPIFGWLGQYQDPDSGSILQDTRNYTVIAEGEGNQDDNPGYPVANETYMHFGNNDPNRYSSLINGEASGHNNTVTLPSVVFRLFAQANNSGTGFSFNNVNDLELHITMLGDHSHSFGVGIKYNITGGRTESKRANFTNLKLSDIKIITDTPPYAIGGSLSNNQKSMTVLIFKGSDQTDNSGVNDPKYYREGTSTYRFYECQSYGDMCDSSDDPDIGNITITATNLMTFDNTQNQGSTSLKDKFSIIPDRKDDYTANTFFGITIRDHSGINYSSMTQSTDGASGYEIAETLANLWNNEHLTNSDLIDPITGPWDDTASALDQAYITVGPDIAGTLGSSIRIGYTDLITPNIDDKGIIPGCVFKLHSIQPEYTGGIYWHVFAPNNKYIVKKIWPKGYYPIDAEGNTAQIADKVVLLSDGQTNTTVLGANTVVLDIITAPELTSDLEANISSQVADNSGTVINDNSGINDEYKLGGILFGLIRVNSNYPDLFPSSISVHAFAAADLDILEFVNDIDLTTYAETASDKLFIETRDLDFGSPGTSKKIYYVDISYQYESVDATNETSNRVSVLVKANNTNSILGPEDGLISPSGIQGLPQSIKAWSKARLYFNPQQSPVKCQSLRIIIKATGLIKDFKLNDLSINMRSLNR